jgi:hypothetical protein
MKHVATKLRSGSEASIASYAALATNSARTAA